MNPHGSAAMLRLARLEFRHAVRWTAWLDPWRRARRGRVPGCWIGVGTVLVVLWATISFGIARSEAVAWQEPSSISLIVIAWLLWSLGGVYVVATSLLTGWATWDSSFGAQAVMNRPAATWALPLPWHLAVAAKALGRTAAFGVHLVIALFILALARLLMIAGNLVSVPPSLADPWFLAAALIHCGIFIALIRVSSAARTDHGTLAAVRMTVFLFLGFGALIVGAKFGLEADLAPGWSLTGLLFAFVTIATIALLQALPPVRWLERRLCGSPRAASDDHDKRDPWRHMSFLHEYLSFSTRGLGGMRERTGEWLVVMLRHVAVMVVVVTLASVLLQAVAIGYTSIVGITSGQPGIVDPDLLDALAVGPALFIFGLAMAFLGIALWPEAMPRGLTRLLQQNLSPDTGRHLETMLPVEPSRLWTQRLITLPLAWVLLGAGALVTLWLSGNARGLLDSQVAIGDFRIAARALIAIAALAAIVSLGLFLVTPILLRARKLIPVSMQALGCLGGMALVGGMMMTMIVMAFVDWETYRHIDDAVNHACALLLIAWLLTGTVLSRALWQPAAWPHDEDGRPGTTAVAQTVFVYAWAMAGPLLLGAAFNVAMEFIAPV